MSIKQFGQINTKDEVLNRIQAALASAVNPVLTNPLLNGTLVTASLLSTGSPPVAHGLGRVPLGWIVVDKDANATVWSPAAATNKVLPLSCSANVNVTLWVF